MASHHPAEFGGHRHFGSKDIIVLVCQAVLARTRDQRIE